MPRVRGISERVLYVFNPLPEVSDKQLLDRAGLDLITPADESEGAPWPFEMYWTYSCGLEGERIHLKPQDAHALRSSEVNEFMRQFKEHGAVVLEDPRDKVEVVGMAIEGLKRALTFYKLRGAVRLQDLRKTHALSKEDMGDYKQSDHWVYYYNEAKADFIKEELERLAKTKAEQNATDDED